MRYGRNHPNGEFSSKETVENIQLSDVEEFYKSYFKPNNAYLVLIGDVSTELSEEFKYFGKWKSDKKLDKKFGVKIQLMLFNLYLRKME